MAAYRYCLLLALVALMVAAPIVRCQDDEDAPVATPSSPIDQYKQMATEYMNQAVEMATPYLEQASELASGYLEKAKGLLDDTLDKLGVNKKDKVEL